MKKLVAIAGQKITRLLKVFGEFHPSTGQSIWTSWRDKSAKSQTKVGYVSDIKDLPPAEDKH